MVSKRTSGTRLTALSLRARKVKLLLMDVDGVLTDGRIYYVPAGEAESAEGQPPALMETKTFHARDGLGIHLIHKAGLNTGLISGRQSPVVEHRVRELGIRFLRQGATSKLGPYQEIIQEAGLSDDQVCFVGDDVVDLPVLARVGLAVAVGDCHPALRHSVHYVTRAPGGLGAVREVIDLILGAQGKLQAALDGYHARDQR